MNSINVAYRRFVTERFPLPSEADVTSLEIRLQVPLPETYRAFLLTYNGGVFNEPRVNIPDNEQIRDRLTYLSGMNASLATCELASEDDLALFTENDPCIILPIGYTMCGNLLALITEPEDNGSVWLHQANTDAWMFLASDIGAFFELLSDP